MAFPEHLKKRIDDVKATIEGIGAVLKMQHGPAAFAYYKALIDAQAYIGVSEALLADYLPKSKFDTYISLLGIQRDQYASLVAEAGALSTTVQDFVKAEVARADVARIELEATMAVEMEKLLGGKRRG